MRLRYLAAVPVAVGLGAVMAVTAAAQAHQSAPKREGHQVRFSDPALAPNSGIHKIKHIIFITQENRSFDNYFGTFPGAVGIPKGVCVPDPRNGGCRRPWVDHHNSNGNDPHAEGPFKIDLNGGKMNGFVRAAEEKLCRPKPAKCHPDVMGHHVASDIPNYWRYAKNFVLQDHFFEAAGSWSLPSHLYQLSGWSAKCTRTGVARSCYGTDMPPERLPNRQTPFAWTDITWLLHRHGIHWAYYLDHGAVTVSLGNPTGTSIHFNPLPGFTDVHKDGQLGSMRPLSVFYRQAKAGTLPKVSWVAPDFRDSEHGPALVSTGQAYVTRLINAVMRGPNWSSCAIFVTWDDWGGFYDNLKPPVIDHQGYGFRVPGLLISPFAKHGYIDHQILSTDAYLRFIEDDFMGGARLNPHTDGRFDPRPDVREAAKRLGNLIFDFNFSRHHRRLLLNPCPATTLVDPVPQPGCHDHIALHVATWGDS